MIEENPYSPPVSNVNAPALGDLTSSEVPPTLVETMRLTKPWVKFLGILGFIGCGLFVVVGIGFFALGSGKKDLPAWMGLVYIPIALIYIPPSLYLYRYATSLERFLRRASVENLGDALGHQKAFWRFIGIAFAAIMGIYGVILAMALVVGVIAAVTKH
jgi:hypothetical protein